MNERRLGDLLLGREEIEEKVEEVAKNISADYENKRPILAVILKGAVYFAVDLSRNLDIPFDLDFLALSGFKPGLLRVEIEKDLDIDIKGRDVLIVEDIVDTGLTLNFLTRELEKRVPQSIKICTFLDCPARRIAEIPIHYRCFEIPDVYVVGYGLDFQGSFRNLMEVYTLYDQSGRSTQILKQMGKGGKK